MLIDDQDNSIENNAAMINEQQNDYILAMSQNELKE
jgi:hypothetical protein